MRREVLPEIVSSLAVSVFQTTRRKACGEKSYQSYLKLSCVCVPDYEKEGMRREVLPEIVSSLAMSVFQNTRRKACGEKSYQR